MGTQGIGTFQIDSKFASGNFVFYEKGVGRTATGDVLTVGTGAVTIGGTAQDVDLAFYGTGSISAIIDAGDSSFTLVGINMATNAPVAINDATASTSTATGALVVTGGVGTGADIYVGDDIFLTSAAKLDWNDGDVTITHAANTLTIASGLLSSTHTSGFSSTATFVPDATRTNYAFAVGSRATELDLTMAASADQNFDPVQINLNVIGANPTNTSTFNGIYQQITHDTTAMANIRVKGGDWTVTIGQNATDAYVYQGELQHTATATLSGESICMSALTSLSASVTVTADRVCAFQAMINGSGAAATVTGDCFVAYIVNAGTVNTTDAICKVYNQSAATATIGLHIDNDGTITDMIKVDGGATYLLNLDDAATFITSGGTDCTASGATDPAYTIKILDPAGAAGYIRVWAAA